MKDTFTVYFYTGTGGRDGWHLSAPFTTREEANTDRQAKLAGGITAYVETTRRILNIGPPETPPGVSINRSKIND